LQFLQNNSTFLLREAPLLLLKLMLTLLGFIFMFFHIARKHIPVTQGCCQGIGVYRCLQVIIVGPIADTTAATQVWGDTSMVLLPHKSIVLSQALRELACGGIVARLHSGKKMPQALLGMPLTQERG